MMTQYFTNPAQFGSFRCFLRSWKWWKTQNCEMPNVSDTRQIWPTRFASIAWDTAPESTLLSRPDLAWSSSEISWTIWLLRCPWCNGYRRRMWTRRHEFKSWTSLITFHIALIPLGKVWIQIFSLQLWVNSRADYILTNLLSTSIHGDKEKEKNPARILPGEKRKSLSREKKKRPTSSHQLKKIKRYAISWSKEQKPTAKCCNATITKRAQY